MAETLRVIDFGRRSPLRSQTLWHAIGYGVSKGAPPTLSFVRPAAAYVSVGYHRRLDEVDRAFCGERGLPVYRRMVGGGPVYLDDGQLFFQLCLPADAVPGARHLALRSLLEPAVAAFRAAGVPAELDAHGEICVGDQKICGHAAGQIEDAVIVCGNLIERFDHPTATRILHLPDAEHRELTGRLMQRYVRPTPADPQTFRTAMVSAYAAKLRAHPRPGRLTADERAALDDLDTRFVDDQWLAGPHRPVPAPAPVPAAVSAPPPVPAAVPATGQASGAGRVRQVKVRAGVWTFAAEVPGAGVVAGVVAGRVESVLVRCGALNGRLGDVRRELVGAPIDKVPDVLAGFGTAGGQVAAAFALADTRGL